VTCCSEFVTEFDTLDDCPQEEEAQVAAGEMQSPILTLIPVTDPPSRLLKTLDACHVVPLSMLKETSVPGAGNVIVTEPFEPQRLGCTAQKVGAGKAAGPAIATEHVFDEQLSETVRVYVSGGRFVTVAVVPTTTSEEFFQL